MPNTNLTSKYHFDFFMTYKNGLRHYYHHNVTIGATRPKNCSSKLVKMDLILKYTL